MSNHHRTTTIFLGAGALLIAATAAIWATSPDTTPPPPPIPTPIPTPTPSPNLTPVSKATTGDILKMTSRLSHPYLLKGVGDVDVRLQIDVDAAKARSAQRSVPLDVAIVIDCSSSMAGQKMVDARIAAQDFVMRLRDGDRVTVVPYSSGARVEVPMTTISSGSKADVQRAIGALTSSGATNISDALTLARNTLDGYKTGTNRVRRILLLSDGQATAGNTNPEYIASLANTSRIGGVTTSTLGLGEDYNELVMTQVANKGGGNYYFIADSTQLAASFTKEFATLQTSVASNTNVVIQLAPGVRFNRMHGYEHVQNGNRITIPLGEFWAGRNASMLLNLRLDRTLARLQNIATVELEYNNLLASNSLVRASHVSTLSAVVTANAAQVEQHMDPEVAVRYEQFLNIDAQEQAMKRYESGDVGGARTILSTRQEKLRRSQKKFKASGKFDDSNGYLLDGLNKDYEQVEEAQKAVDSYGAGSSGGKKFLKKNRATNWSKGRSNVY